MVVWGGVGGSYHYVNVGGRYHPMTDGWVPTGNTPTPRSRHAAVWTGAEMIIRGGTAVVSGILYADTGGKYDPSKDSWAPTTTASAPTGGELPTAVWTGTEMIVWGGYSYDGANHELNTGGKYNPGTNNWIATSTTNVPAGRDTHGAVWTGSEMIV